MSNPKADRLALMNHCEANFSPIFGLYRDEDFYLDNLGRHLKEQAPPVIDFTDEEGQNHRVWAVTDPAVIYTAREFFKEKKLFIADGHHRYETALQFYQQKKRETGNAQKYNHVLMALVNIYDEGLLSFPTHRLLARSRIETETLLSRLEENFILMELAPPESREKFQALLEGISASGKGKNISLALYTPEGRLFKLQLKESGHLTFPLLDTFVLQELILEQIFGLGEAERKDRSDLFYLKDEWETKKSVDNNEATFAFFLNKPPMEEIIGLAEQGIRMPQKSTYFYPKLVTGLIMLKY